MPEAASDLAATLLEYIPDKRATMLNSLTHPFFDELREPGFAEKAKTPVPELFNFTEEGEVLRLCHLADATERVFQAP